VRENNKDECSGTDVASRGQFSDTDAVCPHKVLSLNG